MAAGDKNPYISGMSYNSARDELFLSDDKSTTKKWCARYDYARTSANCATCTELHTTSPLV